MKKILTFFAFVFIVLSYLLSGCKEDNPINNNIDPPLGNLISIEVLPANPTIPIGQNRQFSAKGYYSEGGTQDITSSVLWASENTSIARIDSNGLASGVSEGATIVNAVFGGSISGSSNIIVEDTVVTLWATVSAGYRHTMALKTNGTLWAWGYNGNGQFGNGTTTSTVIPIKIGSLTWSKISVGDYYTLGIKSDGTLWAWGENQNGQLGTGNIQDQHLPTQISNFSDWITITAGSNYNLALRANGTLWAWGNNQYGKLGLGIASNTNILIPTQVGSESNWIFVQAHWGDHSMGIKSDGTLWGWGLNNSGQLGNGTTANTNPTPQKIGIENNWKSVCPGASHTIALKNDGSLWAWGYNGFGQLGNGTFQNQLTPVRIGNETWTSISAGGYHSVGIKANGTLWSWGRNNYGQLGNASNTNSSAPVQEIRYFAQWTLISAGWEYTFAKRIDNTVWVWGNSDYNVFGGFTQ
ncbi:MAG TPA: Ig-like domain-containing protein [Ignavibacteria bacterium]|nr:Ig-like domain-containing protein [Ignavibacteria bacterium]